jgi:hypothetical protein
MNAPTVAKEKLPKITNPRYERKCARPDAPWACSTNEVTYRSGRCRLGCDVRCHGPMPSRNISASSPSWATELTDSAPGSSEEIGETFNEVHHACYHSRRPTSDRDDQVDQRQDNRPSCCPLSEVDQEILAHPNVIYGGKRTVTATSDPAPWFEKLATKTLRLDTPRANTDSGRG